MSEAACAVEGCQKTPTAPRGWCWAHYQRWRKYGDVTFTKYRNDMTPLERWHDSYEVMPSGCWEWRRSLSKGGYGQSFDGERRSRSAHRWGYEQLVGPVPDGLDLDHLCRNRSCVNPTHLEPVTRRENLLRGNTLPAANVTKTHCPAGHPYSGDNLYVFITPSGHPGRRCRACKKARRRAKDGFVGPEEVLV